MPATLKLYPILATIHLQTTRFGDISQIHRGAIVSLPEPALRNMEELSVVVWRRFLFRYKGPSLESPYTVELDPNRSVPSQRNQLAILKYLSEKMDNRRYAGKPFGSVLRIRMDIRFGATPAVSMD